MKDMKQDIKKCFGETYTVFMDWKPQHNNDIDAP